MSFTRRLLVAVLGAVVAGPPPAAAQEAWQGDVGLLLGGRRLNRQDWEPTERMGQLGLVTSWLPPRWPVALAGDLLFAGDDADARAPGGLGEQRGRTTELDLGVRKTWRPGGGAFRPYLGGGLSFITGRIELAGPAGTVTDEDDGAGLWVGGGLGWLVGKGFELGLDARLSRARTRLFGDNKNAGGGSLGVLLGYHWGGGELAAAPAPAAPTPAAPAPAAP
ncbi:hypothetical protein EPO15_08140 [bacterium]|nr:MAG: hypothetical protein EPO15_08140 [bacterium]